MSVVQFVEDSRIGVRCSHHKTKDLILRNSRLDSGRAESPGYLGRPLLWRPATVQTDGAQLDARQNVWHLIDLFQRPNESLFNKKKKRN